jgi:hypothetical protein
VVIYIERVTSFKIHNTILRIAEYLYDIE